MDNQMLEAYEKDQANAEGFIKNVYSAKVPPPEQPNTSFWNLVGLKTAFFSMSSLGAIVFSAVRTGGYFYLVEVVMLSKYGLDESLVVIFAMVAFIAALLAFEGYALADGFSKGEQMTGVEENRFGLWASFLTIALVGIFSGLELADIADGLRNTLNIIVAVITSIAAASIAFFGGKNLGFAVGEFRRKKASIIKEHQKSYDEWRERAYASYTSNVGGFKKRVQSGVQNEQNSEQFVQGNVQQVFNEPEKLNVAERAYDFVNSFVQEHEKIPTVTEVEQKGQFKRTMASYAINDYIAYNAKELVKDDVVTQEKATRAIQSVEKRRQ